MDKQLVNIKINNFRNIKRADIALNGITVVSGINGCGKSTISRLLYYILKNSIDYEDLADPVESGEEVVANLEEAIDLIKSVIKELKALENK